MLSSILSHKTMMSAQSQVCHAVQHNDKLLKHAKSATYVAIGTGQTQPNLKASKPQNVTLCIVTLMCSVSMTEYGVNCQRIYSNNFN